MTAAGRCVHAWGGRGQPDSAADSCGQQLRPAARSQMIESASEIHVAVSWARSRSPHARRPRDRCAKNRRVDTRLLALQS
jgi:hypothetical protein